MNTEKLSDRLDLVARFVPAGSRLADIGSDHAYLPCHLVKKGTIPFAIAGEVVNGPYQSARKHVVSEGLAEAISVRLGDGLDVIEAGEVNCITIAGMGGPLITSILARGEEKLAAVNRLVLQPNIAAVSIRKWLLEHGWELIGEEIMEEDGKIYEILVAEKGDPFKPYGKNLEAELFLGPLLLQKKSAAFKVKWSTELETWKKIQTQLENAEPTQQTIEKKQELLQKIKWVEEALKK
ncbi:tRNA (adenine(22)-N(1))-methyltransferase [Bacillota bacterium Lsc_1132]